MASTNGTNVPIDQQYRVGHAGFPKHGYASSKSKPKFCEQFSQSAHTNSNAGVFDNKSKSMIQNASSTNSLPNKHNSMSSLAVEPSLTDIGPVQSDARFSENISTDQEKKASEYRSVKDSSVSGKFSDGTSSLAKTSGRLDFVESGKSSLCRGSTSTDVSDESSCSSFSSSISKPHKGNDLRLGSYSSCSCEGWSLGFKPL